MAKKTEYCDQCDSPAKYRVNGHPVCGNHLLSSFKALVGTALRSVDDATISVDVGLLNRRNCQKKSGCGYWDHGCMLDKCVLE